VLVTSVSPEGHTTQPPSRFTEASLVRKLEELGFPSAHRRVVPVGTAGGGTLYKVRVGPFPDRESAHRVMQRMRAAGFPDAWVVTK